MFDRLAESGRTYQLATTMHLSKYAEDGLRTMVFGYKKISPPDYSNWSSVFSKAKATIGPERDELLEAASDMIEKDLILLGAVAVEDKLQKGVRYSKFQVNMAILIVSSITYVNIFMASLYQVPGCIDKLVQAGLKIWLLTGDKKETAINIGCVH